MLALVIFLVTLLFVSGDRRSSAPAGARSPEPWGTCQGVIHLGGIPTVRPIVWDATFTFVALIVISLVAQAAAPLVGSLPLGVVGTSVTPAILVAVAVLNAGILLGLFLMVHATTG